MPRLEDDERIARAGAREPPRACAHSDQAVARSLCQHTLRAGKHDGGAGKSSVLRAGVLQQLRRIPEEEEEDDDDRAPVAVVYFGAWQDAPVDALLECIRVSIGEATGSEVVVELETRQ